MSMLTRFRSPRGGSPFARLASMVPDGASIHPAGPRNALFFTTLALQFALVRVHESLYTKPNSSVP